MSDVTPMTAEELAESWKWWTTPATARISVEAWRNLSPQDLRAVTLPTALRNLNGAVDMLADALAIIDILTARAEAAEARVKRLEEVLQGAISEYDRNVCHHETLVRGGAIWTICQDCGAKWADDEGGFVPYQDPPKISIARAALTTGGSHADEA